MNGSRVKIIVATLGKLTICAVISAIAAAAEAELVVDRGVLKESIVDALLSVDDRRL